MTFRPLAAIALGATVLLALTACGRAEPTEMPEVVGLQLDVALSDIERAGFGGDVEIVGGGLFGVVDEGNWTVCDQEPAAGDLIDAPRLVVERECMTAEEPAAEPSPSADPSESAEAVDTTIDELLDRLNSADMGGVQIGDRFRFTGDLVAPEFWGVGATGDYFVYFSANDGANDLMVLVEAGLAADWTDGTRIEVLVENVERTVDGETSDGWLEVVSATVLG